MIQFDVNLLQGKIVKKGIEENIEEKNGKELHKAEENKTATVSIISMEEFESWNKNLAYRKKFAHSLLNHQYCKVEKYGNCLFGTIQMPSIDKRKEMSFGYYLNEKELIFVQMKGNLEIQVGKIKNNLYENAKLSMFLLVFLESFLTDDFHYLQELENELGRLEESVLKKIPDDFNLKLMSYRKKISLLHSYYQQLMDLGELMQDNLLGDVTRDEINGWQHYFRRVERYHNHVEMLREYVLQIHEFEQSLIAQKQNSIMEFLTMITTIFFPLTLITGWYGMNFSNMHELNSAYGYPLVIVISLLIIVIEILYFRKKKML